MHNGSVNFRWRLKVLMPSLLAVGFANLQQLDSIGQNRQVTYVSARNGHSETVCFQTHVYVFICDDNNSITIFSPVLSSHRLSFFNGYSVAISSVYRGADKSLARPGRKQATATEDFEFHISYL